MSGTAARSGFRFQDLYLLLRVLRAASESFDEAWLSGARDVTQVLSRSPLRFGVEASPREGFPSGENSIAPDWDVLVLAQDKLEFAEVKSGAIAKEDRIAFWRRLRRELTKGSTTGQIIAPVLVVDPGTAGELAKWQALAKAAVRFLGLPPNAEPHQNVYTEDQLLEEALWFLCRPDASPDDSDPPVLFGAARDALCRFELHSHEAAILDGQVSQFIELLFPGGLTDTQKALLLGWLNERATDTARARRLFTIGQLLGEIGILQETVSLFPGTLSQWRNLWIEVPRAISERTRLRLGDNGASVSTELVQPTALKMIGNSRNLILLGPGGAGKSTLMAQVAQAAEQRGDLVLHCGADDLNLDELDALVCGFRFRAALAALRNPSVSVSLFVDGLDEAEAPLRKRWAQLLTRLVAVPNVRLFASSRDEVWRSDGDIRRILDAWSVVNLVVWPENIVRELLAGTRYAGILPSSVVELLRTPILLDLFWQAFVETESPDVSKATQLQSRHNLLAAFWELRLLGSPRYAAIQNFAPRLAKSFSEAARTVGAFMDSNLDSPIVALLLSEGVLVREGRLQPRVRFRHSLLRDFALSQWCLECGDSREGAKRLDSVQGGLQRYGTLRAISEALSDPGAPTDYPQLSLPLFVQAAVQINPGLAQVVAQVLGTRIPIRGLDPATWPPELQASLPRELGCDILATARLDGNGTWAFAVERWPDDAHWLSKDYPREVWQYASFLLGRLKSDQSIGEWREQCRSVARKLRLISEVPRFSSEFTEPERWLKMQAMAVVIPVLPDVATLAWIERELTHPSWRTRSTALDWLAVLAPIDPARVGFLYRQAVGISKANGGWTIDQSTWGMLNERAIEWSLDGEGGRRSLLKEHAATFLPIALDLAEALWLQSRLDDQNGENGIMEFMRRIDPSWSEEAAAENARAKQQLLENLLDDSPEWTYWRALPKHSFHERCLRAIQHGAEHWARTSRSTFISEGVAILRSSRLASIHSIAMSVLLDCKEDPSAISCLRNYAADSRLYHVSGMSYWLEQALLVSWSTAATDERDRILAIIRTLIGRQSEMTAKRLLARLPADDLPADLQRQRPSESEEAYQPTRRPQSMSMPLGGEWTPVEEDPIEEMVRDWPECVDPKLLADFACATKDLSNRDTPIETLAEKVPGAIQVACALVQVLRNNPGLMEGERRFWVWRNLAETLNCFQKVHQKLDDKKGPPEELITSCAGLALEALEDVPSSLPGKLPDSELWLGCPDTIWVHALRLADAALIWPPLAEDSKIQADFSKLIQDAFAKGNALLQLVCATVIRPWHWFRNDDRRALHDRLIWSTPKHGSVLRWSLAITSYYPDDERTRVFRLLLARSDLEESKQLAHGLGEHIGNWSMHVFRGDRRSMVADLARELVDGAEAFPLTQDSNNRGEFLERFIVGMTTTAGRMSDHQWLADDYGDWALKVWRALHTGRGSQSGSAGVIFLTMHWLSKTKHQSSVDLGSWWQHLQKMFHAVALEGGPSDCFTLFFNLHDGEYNDLAAPRELLKLVEVFIDRVGKQAGDQPAALDECHPGEGYHSWRECSDHAAKTLDSLRRDGSLQTELVREEAHQLLTRLGAEPIRSQEAREALHRFHNE
jgi:hypothetical protein